MAAALPHLSFLGFEAVLQRLAVAGAGPSPGGRSAWRLVDGRARTVGERTVAVAAGDRSTDVTVDESLHTRSRGRLRTQVVLEVEADAPFRLRRWSRESVVLDRHGGARPTTRAVDAGRVKRQTLEWDRSTRPPRPLSDRPLLSPVSLPALAEHDAALEVPPTRFFDLFEDHSEVAETVRWASCGRAAWSDHALRGWRCVGPSMLPWHVWTGPTGAAWLMLGLERAWVRASLLGGDHE